MKRIFAASAIAVLLASPLTASASEEVIYYLSDPQGTPLAIMDAYGNVISSSDHTPFGSPILGGGHSGIDYTGHLRDDYSSLIYMQARYYDPEVGRFLSADPPKASAGDLMAFNRFAYGHNNPINTLDPDGRKVIFVSKGA